MFEPIAIIGSACLLPGAKSPQELWENVLAGKNCLKSATPELWGIQPDKMQKKPDVDGVFTDQCGYPEEFIKLFDPQGFALDAEIILQHSELTQWLLHLGREAFHAAGYSMQKLGGCLVGGIIGNLSYPNRQFQNFCHHAWLTRPGNGLDPTLLTQLKNESVNPLHRFMSGYPIHVLAQGLSLSGPMLALDAACASSLYAIKLACDALHDRKADMMLAGGINAVDSLYLQVGFTALQAVSKTGQSLPLSKHADGLIPAQGAAVVVLKRLADAVKDHDTILGVIRGIGLSNDGRGKGFLVPSEAGQIMAMQAAYANAGVNPQDIEWVECHATGTQLGDSVEINSMRHIFQDNNHLTLGALKANIGHTITASAAAGLINTLSAFNHAIKPAALYAAKAPADSLLDSSFKLLNEPEEWHPRKNSSRFAAINAFGFGGNNAHLVLEDFAAKRKIVTFPAVKIKKKNTHCAIVGIGILAASAKSKEEFEEAVFQEKSLLSEYDQSLLGGYMDEVDLDVAAINLPPNELKRSLGQQLAIIKATHEALSAVKMLNPKRTTAIIGMQTDTLGSLTPLSWRLENFFPDATPEWLNKTRADIFPPTEPGHVLGCMPNIVANRLNYMFKFEAPSFSVSAEELSGIKALQLGLRALAHDEIDTAVVGAVDMNCEFAHVLAMQDLNYTSVAGDAAVVLVLKRLDDAKRDGDKIYAVLASDNELEGSENSVTWNVNNSVINELAGYSQASIGLLNLAAAALSLTANSPSAGHDKRQIKLEISAFGQQQDTIVLMESNEA